MGNTVSKYPLLKPEDNPVFSPGETTQKTKYLRFKVPAVDLYIRQCRQQNDEFGFYEELFHRIITKSELGYMEEHLAQNPEAFRFYIGFRKKDNRRDFRYMWEACKAVAEDKFDAKTCVAALGRYLIPFLRPYCSQYMATGGHLLSEKGSQGNLRNPSFALPRWH